jgi:hypothetical protein
VLATTVERLSIQNDGALVGDGFCREAEHEFEHDLFGKPDSTFPDHALERFTD